jgi:thiamine-phosphate pyrophosphorylase
MPPTGARRDFNLSLYLITDPALTAARGLVDTVRAAVAGGVTLVQLRDKAAADDELIRQAAALREALEGTGVPLIINDRIAVARAAGAGAAGVHVGQSDEAARIAREMLGPDAIVGLSAGSVAEAAAVDAAVVDYVGIGPIFATATKSGHRVPIGFDGFAAIRAAAPVPAVAIGGIRAEHAGGAIRAGADGLAVVSAICAAADITAAARHFSEKIAAARAAQPPPAEPT